MYGLDDNTSDLTSKIYDEGWRKEGLKSRVGCAHLKKFLSSLHPPYLLRRPSSRRGGRPPEDIPAHLPAARQAPISLSACVHAQAGMS